MKLLGISFKDKVCDHCGKTNSRTWGYLLEDGRVVHYGTNCAFVMLRKRYMGRNRGRNYPLYLRACPARVL
jgi:hypothetical protein